MDVTLVRSSTIDRPSSGRTVELFATAAASCGLQETPKSAHMVTIPPPRPTIRRWTTRTSPTPARRASNPTDNPKRPKRVSRESSGGCRKCEAGMVQNIARNWQHEVRNSTRHVDNVSSCSDLLEQARGRAPITSQASCIPPLVVVGKLAPAVSSPPGRSRQKEAWDRQCHRLAAGPRRLPDRPPIHARHA